MADPTPIKPDLLPSYDASREMIDTLMRAVSSFEKMHAEAPLSVSMVLSRGTKVFSMDFVDVTDPSRFDCINRAATLLRARAMSLMS